MLKIGVVGVGNIGQGMVRQLLDNGYETHIYAPRSHEDIAAAVIKLYEDIAGIEFKSTPSKPKETEA